jgi:hypothetical protein
MDFGRQSNLGSLVSAVLVGLLALAANQYARLDPRKLDQFIAGIDVMSRKQEPEVFSVKTVRDTLQQCETQLMPLYLKWKGSLVSVEDPRIEQLLAKVDSHWKELANHPEVQAELNLPDRLAMVRILFAAAEMDPMRFTEPFTAANIQMAQVADASVAGKGAALELYHRHNFEQPVIADILSDLRQFSQSHSQPEIGGEVYLLMAHELKGHGQHASALRVLELGLESYRGTSVAPRLINEQIQLRLQLGKPISKLN